jgi:hypothetical protein
MENKTGYAACLKNVVVVVGRSWQATNVPQPVGLLYRPLFERSNFSLLDAPASTDAFRTPAAEVGTTMSGNRPIISLRCRLPRYILGSFTCRKSATWDPRLYIPSEGRRAEDFSALKNPTASAGFEPSNLGTRGQHANP